MQPAERARPLYLRSPDRRRIHSTSAVNPKENQSSLLSSLRTSVQSASELSLPASLVFFFSPFISQICPGASVSHQLKYDQRTNTNSPDNFSDKEKTTDDKKKCRQQQQPLCARRLAPSSDPARSPPRLAPPSVSSSGSSMPAGGGRAAPLRRLRPTRASSSACGTAPSVSRRCISGESFPRGLVGRWLSRGAAAWFQVCNLVYGPFANTASFSLRIGLPS